MKNDAKIKALQSQIAGLQDELRALEGAKISPLAPKAGFPELPVIEGVRFASTAAGVKYQGRDDVMLAEVCAGASIAGVFTKSSTRSAPVLWCQDNLTSVSGGSPVGILVNSGNANAFTGKRGVEAVRATAEKAAKVLGTVTENIFVSSTGVIGEVLPADRIVSAMDTLASSLADSGAAAAARAIMTTDTYPKGASAQIEVDGRPVTIAGFAKGSGMIAPDMATMLVYIFTDATIAQADLQEMVSEICDETFNSITVDSDTSTSDTLIVAATGKSAAVGGAPEFRQALGVVMRDLAHQVVKDGEGATKFLEIEVQGAVSDKSAKVIAQAIANSPLVKTAVAGEDPNWGRVVMAIGKSGEPADRDAISIWFGDHLVAQNGWVAPEYREETGAAYMKADDLAIRVELGAGTGSATVWTCDLTHDYITINADYRS